MRIHFSTFHICSNIVVIIFQHFHSQDIHECFQIHGHTSHKMPKPNKVGNPFVFHTLAFDKSTGNDDGRTGNNRDRSEGDKGFRDLEEAEFLMYYSAGSTHLADSNIDEPLYLGLGQ